MHCIPFFRITVFTGIYILKSDLKNGDLCSGEHSVNYLHLVGL